MICPRNFLQTADSDIIVSLHLVIPFISMVVTRIKGLPDHENFYPDFQTKHFYLFQSMLSEHAMSHAATRPFVCPGKDPFPRPISEADFALS